MMSSHVLACILVLALRCYTCYSLSIVPKLGAVRKWLSAGSAVLTLGILPAHADEKLFGLKDGRLLVCPAKSNCVSTSSVNSVEKYSRPWVYSSSVSANEMYNQILNAAKSSEFFKVEEQDKDKLYIHLTAKSAVPPTSLDDIEFLINASESFITYRSNSREVVFAGTQQLGDGGSNKNRLQQLQRKLGVADMGVDDYDSDFFETSGSGLPFDGLLPSTNFFKYQKIANNPAEINFLDGKAEE